MTCDFFFFIFILSPLDSLLLNRLSESHLRHFHALTCFTLSHLRNLLLGLAPADFSASETRLKKLLFTIRQREVSCCIALLFNLKFSSLFLIFFFFVQGMTWTPLEEKFILDPAEDEKTSSSFPQLPSTPFVAGIFFLFLFFSVFQHFLPSKKIHRQLSEDSLWNTSLYPLLPPLAMAPRNKSMRKKKERRQRSAPPNPFSPLN